jgi:hypothetical protein
MCCALDLVSLFTLLSPSLRDGLVAVSLLLVPITLWTWNRVRGPRAVQALQRLGLIVTCQVVGVLMVAVIVNDYGYFYGSWSELLGRADKVVASGAHDRVSDVPDEVGVVGGGGVLEGPYSQQVGRAPARDGQVVRLRLLGRRSALSQDGLVYLPPEYFWPRFARYRFPAVEVLTGFPGQVANLVRTLDFPAALMAAERAGRAGPMVLVMLRSSPAFPRDTECVDVPRGPQSLTFFSQDVPADVATLLRVRPLGWGAIGDSTGGYCAVKLAMTDSYVFTAAVSLSGYFKAAEDPTTGDLFGGSKGLSRQADLGQRLKDGTMPDAALLLTTSRTERGPSSVKDLRAFVALVRPPLVVDTVIAASGGHNFGTWRPLLPMALDWLSAHLRARVPPVPITASSVGAG